MKRFPLVAGAWTILLIVGFSVVFLLGGKVQSSVQELESALNPPTPVTQATAEASADTIVRLQYPTFLGIERTVRKDTDFGKEHWVIEYTDGSGAAPRGLRISIAVASGRVEVNSFP